MTFIRTLTIIALSTLPITAISARASDEAKSIINTMIQKEKERSAGVDSYVVWETYSVGKAQILLYEKLRASNSNSSEFVGYRLVPPDEISLRLNEEAGGSTAQYVGVADLMFALRELGLTEAVNKGILPVETANKIGGDLAGGWMRARATAGNVHLFVDRDDAKQAAADMHEFGEIAEVSRKTGPNGRDYFELLATEIGKKQNVDGGEYTIDTISLYVDSEYYVPLRLKMTGESKTKQSGTNPLEILKTDTNYTAITGSSLFKPFNSTMQIKSKFLPDDKKKEMVKAQKEYLEFQKQLESMTDEQKKMMEQMLGDKFEEQIMRAQAMMSAEAVGTTVTVKKICIGGIEAWLSMMAELHNVDPGEFIPVGPEQCMTQ